MSEPFSNIAVVIGPGATNRRAITSGSVTINTGGVNRAPITGDLTIAGGVNEVAGIVTGSVTLSSGTNKASVTGNLTMTGGTNASTSFVNGNLTMTGGTNNAVVQGNASVIDGTNNARVSGSVFVGNGGVQGGVVYGAVTVAGTGTITQGASVFGSIFLGSGVSSSIVDGLAGYNGTVVVRGSGDTLQSITYTSGAAGEPSTLSGNYYNLENDSKAYHYANGSKSLFTGAAYNLTGDNKAYSWSSGVQGALFTGTVDGFTFLNGIIQSSSTYNSWTVTNDSNGGTLYTDTSATSAATGTVYSDSALTALYTGVFTENNADYYAVDGVTQTYIQYTVTLDSNSGYLYSAPLFNAGPSDYLYTESSLTNKYTGFYKYSDTYYKTVEGVVSLFTGVWTAAGSYYAIVNGSTAQGSPTGVLQLLNDGLYYNFDGTNTIGSLFTGAALAGTVYLGIDNGVVGSYATGIRMLDSDGLYYNFPGEGSLGTLLGAGVQQAADGLFYVFLGNGVAGELFTGVYGNDYGSYNNVDSGVVTQTTAIGLRMLASDELYYNFTGNNILPSAFTGAIEAVSGYYFSILSGVKESTPTFTGAYADESNNFYNIDSGEKKSSYATGLRMLASNGLYYNFNGSGGAGTLHNGAVVSALSGLVYSVYDGAVSSSLFNGAYLDNSNYHPVINGVIYFGNYATGILISAGDGLYHNFPGDGSSGTLFTGAAFDGTNYQNVDSGLMTGTLAVGVRMLISDGLYYNFSGVSGDANKPSSAFNGGAEFGSAWYNVSAGVRGGVFTGAFNHQNGSYYNIEGGNSTYNNASGVRMLAGDGLYYNFNGSGGAGTLHNGAVEVEGVWISVSAGAAGDVFTGAYLDNSTYRPVIGGVAYSSQSAMGVFMLTSDGLYYSCPGDGTGTLHNGAVEIGGTWYSVVAGARGDVFTGAAAYQGHYHNIDAGHITVLANGVRMLAGDGLYYNFNGSGLPGTLHNGAVEVGGTWYSVVDGVRGGTFAGAYLSQGTYRNIDAGQTTYDNATGVRILVNDGLVYDFTGNGGPGTPHNGAVEIGGTWYYVSSGGIGGKLTGAYYYQNSYRNIDAGQTTSTYATGVRMLVSDGLYYNFPGTGGAGSLFTGILETSPAPGGNYPAYKDGALYISNVGINHYNSSCDDSSSKVWLVLEGTNISSKVIKAGTGALSGQYVSYSAEGSTSGSFEYQGYKYNFSDGVISSMAICDPYTID